METFLVKAYVSLLKHQMHHGHTSDHFVSALSYIICTMSQQELIDATDILNKYIDEINKD